jgi:hypothetical protein
MAPSLAVAVTLLSASFVRSVRHQFQFRAISRKQSELTSRGQGLRVGWPGGWGGRDEAQAGRRRRRRRLPPPGLAASQFLEGGGSGSAAAVAAD